MKTMIGRCFEMDSQRAQEIVSSPHMLNVTYNGTRIYMEKVDPSGQNCTVHYLNKPSKKLDVPLGSLVEHS